MSGSFLRSFIMYSVDGFFIKFEHFLLFYTKSNGKIMSLLCKKFSDMAHLGSYWAACGSLIKMSLTSVI